MIFANPFLFLVPLVLIGGFIFLWATWTKGQNIKITIPQVLPLEGFFVPIKGNCYGSLQSKFGFSYFKLFDDHFEIRVLNIYKFSYSQVKDIGYFDKYGGNVEIMITFNDSDKSFYAFISKYNLKEVLVFFKGKGCKLTEKGESFITAAN